MANIKIRSLDDTVKARLRLRAAKHGRSIEEEARNILRSALSEELQTPQDLAEAIHWRFAKFGGVDLPEVPRGPAREPPTSDE